MKTKEIRIKRHKLPLLKKKLEALECTVTIGSTYRMVYEFASCVEPTLLESGEVKFEFTEPEKVGIKITGPEEVVSCKKIHALIEEVEKIVGE